MNEENSPDFASRDFDRLEVNNGISMSFKILDDLQDFGFRISFGYMVVDSGNVRLIYLWRIVAILQQQVDREVFAKLRFQTIHNFSCTKILCYLCLARHR